MGPAADPHDMPPSPVVYTPQSVLLPPELGIERSFDEYDISPEQDALCDHRTIFCDVFLSPDRRELHCIGPPFGSLGKPKMVKVEGSERDFSIDIPHIGRIFSLVRIDIHEHEVETELHVEVAFRRFAVEFVCTNNDRPMRYPVRLTLSAIQKDNDPQWIADWCTWHHRVHGVERIVIYDNGSEGWDGAYYSGLDGLDCLVGFELIVVKWDFPFGPPDRLDLNFAQPAAVNHCRLTFGSTSAWLINLDIDEYLYNASPTKLVSYLGGEEYADRLGVYLKSYVVPFTVDKSPRRCFDSAVRFRRVENGGQKYIFKPALAQFCGTHWVQAANLSVAEKARIAILGSLQRRNFTRRTLRLLARLKRAVANRGNVVPASKGGASAEEPDLFFYHFRALNTGWKYRRRLVDPRPKDVVVDHRITAMKAVLDDRVAL